MKVWICEDNYTTRVASLPTKALDICREMIDKELAERRERMIKFCEANKLDTELNKVRDKMREELCQSFLENDEYFGVEGICSVNAVEIES